MRVVDERATDEPERCLVTLLGGDRIQGTVLTIDFDGGRLRFQPERSGPRELLFGAIRSLFLSRSVGLEPVPLDLPVGGLRRKPVSERRPCELHFADGATSQVDVVALLPRRAGLFLFVAHYADEVLRWFIPASSLVQYTVAGSPPMTLSDAVEPRAEPVPPEAPPTGAALQTRDDVEDALERRRRSRPPLLEEVLLREGLIDREQLLAATQAQAQAKQPQKHIGELLVDAGAIKRETLREVLVSQLGLPSVRLNRFPVDFSAVKSLSPELARRYTAVPLYREGRRLVVGIEDPLSWQALRELEFATGLKVEPVLCAADDLQRALKQFYDSDAPAEKVAQLVAELGEESSPAPAQQDERNSEADTTLVRLVNKIIADAYDQGASDIHIESRGEGRPSQVRLRIDGVLRPYIEIPAGFRSALISRIKIMAELDISERRKPQDGKIRFAEFSTLRIELRVLVLPTFGGFEDVILRILAAPRALTMEMLGLAPRELQALRTALHRTFGLILVCGPTGSGKTTTLHTMIGAINTPDRKIYTVEDPVEITQPGLSQVQVNAKLGLTFPEVLRSFLRADPDVIMVGETRDQETARTVVSAALTGHLVMTTMHTNSAAESVTRLLDFGLDPYNFSDALLAVVGQRLVRKLCACKSAYAASDEELETMAQEYGRNADPWPEATIERWKSRYAQADGTVRLFAPKGCATCENTGYKGRLGVYEVMIATPRLRSAIQAQAPTRELLKIAQEEGTCSLEQDGIEKILRGEFDLKQVLAACR
ncbi:GspE/PulE family protein [Ramlibacter sp.]|uniref:GspE/PulE family protein n=1 Tax=Ramlibacter sp. TaxID=1917967 RepID=UPI003D11D76E